MRRLIHRRQAGSVLVEFALAFALFWTGLVAVIEFSRLMLAWGMASEATRIAARLASICEPGPVQQARIRDRVSKLVTASGLIDLQGRDDWLVIEDFPAGCAAASSCQFVEARLQNLHPALAIPGLSASIALPSFRIRAMREAMRNEIKGETNADCG